MIIGGCSLLGDDGYEEALDLLKEQFGNKENIFGLIEKDLLEGKQVKSADQVLTFACVLRSAVTSMKVMQKEKDLTQRMISEIVERRLSKGLQGRWRKYALDKKNKHDHYPSFESFVEWIERASRGASDPFYGFSDEPKNSASVHNASRAESHTFEPRAPASRSSESRAAESRSYVSRTNEPRTCPKCPTCGGAHKVSYCENILSYSVDARIDCVTSTIRFVTIAWLSVILYIIARVDLRVKYATRIIILCCIFPVTMSMITVL